MMVFTINGKLHVSAYSGHHQILTTLAIRVLYNMPKHVVDIFYKVLIVRNLSKPNDGRYKPKHVEFHC